MKRLAPFLAVAVVISLWVSPASAQQVVTAGAFCPSVGATGVTTTGLNMVCATTAAEPSQPRWRDVATPGLITAGQASTAPANTGAGATATTAATLTTPTTAAGVTATTRPSTFPTTGRYTGPMALTAAALLLVGLAIAYRARRTAFERMTSPYMLRRAYREGFRPR